MLGNIKLRLFLLAPFALFVASDVSWAGKLEVTQAILDIAPPENEKTALTKKRFSDKGRIDNKDGSIDLSKANPNDKDSCFPILYGEREPISLDFQNATIRNLFRIISEFSGFNVIFSPEVSGSVNIRVLDMPWNQALEIILANSNLGRECYVKGTVRIANKDNLRKAPKIAGAEKKSIPRLLGKELKDIPFLKPEEDSEELKYLHEKREKLGGFLPQRKDNSEALKEPDKKVFKSFLKDLWKI